MDYISMTKTDIDLEYKLLRKYIAEVSRLPHGKMCCKTSQGYKRYYLIENGKQKYISDKELIIKLKTRRFLERAISVIDSNIKAQEKLLLKYKLYDYKTIQDNLPKAYRSDDSLQTENVCSSGGYFEDEKIHCTTFGLRVRSKSEALIAEVLNAEGIEFEYEKPVNLVNEKGNRIVLHPDFTLYTKTKHKILWEHFGMMTVNEYKRNALRKIGMYYDNGITIPDKLVITMDSPNGSFDVMTVKSIIKGFLK